MGHAGAFALIESGPDSLSGGHRHSCMDRGAGRRLSAADPRVAESILSRRTPLDARGAGSKSNPGSLSDLLSRHRLDSFHSFHSWTRFTVCVSSGFVRCAGEATLSGRLETVCTDLTKKAAIQPKPFRWRSPTSPDFFCWKPTRDASVGVPRVGGKEIPA